MLSNEVFVGEVLPQPGHDQLQMVAVDLGRYVEPQAVGVVVVEVHPGILVKEVLHLALPPGGAAAPIGPLAALEVDAALVRVAVVFPQGVIAWAGVVVNHVEDDRKAVPVGGVDEVCRLYGEP